VPPADYASPATETRLRLIIEPDVNRIEPWIFELQLLDVHDEITCPKVHLIGQHHFYWIGGKPGIIE